MSEFVRDQATGLALSSHLNRDSKTLVTSEPRRYGRRGVLVFLGAGALALASDPVRVMADAAASHSPSTGPAVIHSQAAEAEGEVEEEYVNRFYDGSVIKAIVEGHPFSYHPGGRGIFGGVFEIGEEFAEAVHIASGENPRPRLHSLTNTYKSGLTEDEGVCWGIARYQSYINAPVPEQGSLLDGRFVFTRQKIMTLKGLEHSGDANAYTTDNVHHMVEEHLVNGRKFIVDFGLGGAVFQTVVDMAIIHSVRDATNIRGGKRITMSIRVPDYLDPRHQSPGLSRGDKGFFYVTIVYEVNRLRKPDQFLKISSDKPIKYFSISDPMSYLLKNRDGSYGKRRLSADAGLTGAQIQEQIGQARSYRVRGTSFTKTMTRLLEEIAYPAVSLDCPVEELVCVPF